MTLSAKQCPRCGLWNTAVAEKCDCGYEFQTGQAPAARPPAPPFYRQIDFWLGFTGWYLANGLVWQGMGGASGERVILNGLILPANLVALLIAAFIRRRFAGGMLAAVAVNLIIAILVGAFMNATCAIPFFVR